jgi:N-glycosylase/DNA lyase
VKELQSKEGGGEAWLSSLRYRSLDIALEELCSLPGVGPKVAACVALFSLDQHHAIPVDTHVWRVYFDSILVVQGKYLVDYFMVCKPDFVYVIQIATTYIMPELAGARLTAKLHVAVSEAFVKKFGKYAGWAQNVLFIAELLSHQVHLPEHLRTCREKKSKAKNNKKIKIAKG